MASAAQPKLQIGKLSLEDAERLASSFRPAWELDDAPFAPSNGVGIAAADLDALANGAGVTPSIRGTRDKQPELLEAKTEIEIQPAPAPRVPAVHEPKVEIAVDLAPADLVTATPAPVAEARPQSKTIPPVARPYQAPKAPPQAIRMPRDPGASADYAPVKKSNMGLVLAVVGVVVVVGGIFAIRSAMSSDKASTAATATTSSPTHEEKVIPPPPPDTATQQTAQTAPVKTAEPAQTLTAPVQTQVAIGSSSTAAHTAAVTTNITAPVHTASVGGAHTAVAGAGGGHTAAAGTGHKTTIVRDNPF